MSSADRLPARRDRPELIASVNCNPGGEDARIAALHRYGVLDTAPEEAFDTSLHPIRAKVSITARVLTVEDLGFTHRGGLLYLNYQRGKAQYAALDTRTPADLGVKSF